MPSDVSTSCSYKDYWLKKYVDQHLDHMSAVGCIAGMRKNYIQNVRQYATQIDTHNVMQNVTQYVMQNITRCVMQNITRYVMQNSTRYVKQIITRYVMQNITRYAMQIITRYVMQNITRYVMQNITRYYYYLGISVLSERTFWEHVSVAPSKKVRNWINMKVSIWSTFAWKNVLSVSFWKLGDGHCWLDPKVRLADGSKQLGRQLQKPLVQLFLFCMREPKVHLTLPSVSESDQGTRTPGCTAWKGMMAPGHGDIDTQ